DHPSTIAALETTFTELGRAPRGSVGRLARAGRRAQAVARLYGDFRTRTARYYDDDDQLHAAAGMVDAGALDLRDLGQVVVFLPPADLSPAGEAFVLALARAGRARVVLGLTGDVDADRDTRALGARLAAGFGELPAGAVEPGADATEPPAAAAPVADVIVSCSDVDDEVRQV